MSYLRLGKVSGVRIDEDGTPFIKIKRGGKHAARTGHAGQGRRPWERGDTRYRELKAQKKVP